MSFTLSNGIYDTSGNTIVEFDTYIENNYHNSNGVAFEPLEQGSFSSDSKQNTPFQISITPIFVIKDSKSPTNAGKPRVDQVKETLEALAASDLLVSVLLQPFSQNDNNNEYYQYGKYYNNMSLYSIDYQNTPDQLEFRPVLLFQQIRITNTEYTASQNTANPENSATSNQGQVQPVPQDNSIFKSWFG